MRFNFQEMKCPRRTVWNHLSSDAASWGWRTGSSATQKGKLEQSHNCYFFISIDLSEFLFLFFFFAFCFFFVCVYRKQHFTLSLFWISSLLSSTQSYFPLLVHPLPKGFPRSSSTRVTTGPLTYGSNWITFIGRLYTNTRCFLTPHISPAVRLPFVPTGTPACAFPLGFSQPDLKPHPFFLSRVTCTIKLQKPLFLFLNLHSSRLLIKRGVFTGRLDTSQLYPDNVS